MSIKAVLFDLDGTLVDSNDFHVLAWAEAFDGVGSKFDRQALHDQIGKGADMLIPTLLPGADEAAQKRLGEAHDRVFKERFLSQVRPFERARDLLVRVQGAGQRVVFATSASQGDLDHYLELLDARGIIFATTTSEDVQHTKPAPDIFATALKKLAPLRTDEVIVVGDTPYDIEAANKCGIAAIGLRSGKFTDEALLKAKPAAVYDDVADLLANYDRSPLAQ